MERSCEIDAGPLPRFPAPTSGEESHGHGHRPAPSLQPCVPQHGTAGAFSRAGCTASDREEGTVTSKGCRATGSPAPAPDRRSTPAHGRDGQCDPGCGKNVAALSLPENPVAHPLDSCPLLITHLFAPRHPASFLATSSSARLSSEPDTYKMVAARQLCQYRFPLVPIISCNVRAPGRSCTCAGRRISSCPAETVWLHVAPVGGGPVARFLSPTTAPPRGQATHERTLAPVATTGGAAPPGPRTLLASSAIRGIEA